jgi:hypothetical protein
MTAEHTCHAKGCQVRTKPKMLMCLRHWRMVPRAIQAEVWDAYVPGQEISKTPTREYLAVARKAIDHVAQMEANIAMGM